MIRCIYMIVVSVTKEYSVTCRMNWYGISKTLSWSKRDGEALQDNPSVVCNVKLVFVNILFLGFVSCCHFFLFTAWGAEPGFDL
jgi:hypothetical protein